MTHHHSPFTHAIRVYYADTDAGGIVYHARYLEFAERCRAELLRSIAAPLATPEGHQFVVRRSQIDWIAPARLDDLLLCQTTVSSVGGARVGMTHQFFIGETETARIAIELAYVSARHRPVRLPHALIAALAAFS